VIVSKSLRSRLAGLIESSTRRGLKFSIPSAAIAVAYLLYIVFGPKLPSMARMNGFDRVYLEHTVAMAEIVLRVASLVLVISLALRYMYEALIGQILTIAGGVLYFFGPAIFDRWTVGVFASNQLYIGIVGEFTRVGLTALVPGAILLSRDMGARLVAGIKSGKSLAQLWGDEDARIRRHRRRKLYEHCWDMPFCREFVRDVCPAWRKAKSCWRLKCGCYCDEQTILRAMTSEAMDNKYAQRFMQTLAQEQLNRPSVSAKQKRARCRRCVIYTEHQKQKYRVLSPMMFPAVAIVFWVFHDQLVRLLGIVYAGTDRFVSFVTMHQQHALGGEQHMFTVLAIVWLWIVVLSYALLGLEYLIFDLQV